MNEYSILIWDKMPENFDEEEDEIRDFEPDREISRSTLPEAVKAFESEGFVYYKILHRYNDPYDYRCIPDVLMEYSRGDE